MTLEEYSDKTTQDLTNIYVGFDKIVEDVIVNQIIDGELTEARASINEISKAITKYTRQYHAQQKKLIKKG